VMGISLPKYFWQTTLGRNGTPKNRTRSCCATFFNGANRQKVCDRSLGPIWKDRIKKNEHLYQETILMTCPVPLGE